MMFENETERKTNKNKEQERILKYIKYSNMLQDLNILLNRVRIKIKGR